jgi:hypothetical protein
MLDLSHIPNSQQDVKIFYAVSGSNSWQTWQKPRKCSYVWIMCIGGGGGGGGGQVVGSTVGGSGGGSGGVSRALYNAQQLPDTLYVQVGLGGAGGITNSSGQSGSRSWVSLQPVLVSQNLVQGSGTNSPAAGGASGTGVSAAGEVAIAQTTGIFLTLSNFIGTAGQASTAYGASWDTTPLTSQITSAGAGGGSSAFTGNILSSSISPYLPGGAYGATSGSNGGNGLDGFLSWKPFYSLGGSGGGSAISGSGGNGGNGGIGSGGGGGGTGNSLVNPSYIAGRGGKGGDGLVVIISF